MCNLRHGEKRFEAEDRHENKFQYQVCFLLKVGDREKVLFLWNEKGRKDGKAEKQKADWRMCKDQDIPM